MSNELAWLGRPWGKPSPFHDGVVHASWGEMQLNHDEVRRTYDETKRRHEKLVSMLRIIL